MFVRTVITAMEDVICWPQAELQIAASFLPGRVADSHVTMIAKHLVSAVSSVAEKIGLVGTPVALLTRQLGEAGL